MTVKSKTTNFTRGSQHGRPWWKPESHRKRKEDRANDITRLEMRITSFYQTCSQFQQRSPTRGFHKGIAVLHTSS